MVISKTTCMRVGIAILSLATLLAVLPRAGSGGASDPWTSAQLMTPDELAKRLGNAKTAKPLIIYVGFPFLYASAHIPGAKYYGPGAKPAGLEELRKQVKNLPRDKEIVLYCGCCPWRECPNVRPAFRVLREMGFTRLRAANIPTSFAKDWVGKGFPVEKGR